MTQKQLCLHTSAMTEPISIHNFGVEKDDGQMPYLKVHVRSYQKWGRASRCTCHIKRLGDLAGSLQPLHNCSTRCILRFWKITPQSCVSMCKYGENVTMSKSYPRTCVCEFTQTQHHYTCHYLMPHKLRIWWIHWHMPLSVRSWLLATCGIVHTTGLLHVWFAIRGHVYTMNYSQILKHSNLVMDIPPHVTARQDTVSCRCWEW